MNCPYCNQNKWKQTTCQGCGYVTTTQASPAAMSQFYAEQYMLATQAQQSAAYQAACSNQQSLLIQRALQSGPSLAEILGYYR